MFGPLKFSYSAEKISILNQFDFQGNNSTNCLLCDNKFILPSQQDDFCAHLFHEHKLVIADVHLIASLKSYVDFWRVHFSTNPITRFCSTILMDCKPDGAASIGEKYYLLSDVIPEDKQLREGLQKKRLEWVLAQQAKERETRLSRVCLFCKLEFKGPRAEYISHLSNKHNLWLGSPDNLVFTDDLLNIIEEKLNRFECLFCERLFKDRTVLKEHMRKKMHKRINPSNKAFDRFYVINYLEMGKSWQQVQEEPEDKETPDESSDWSDWEDSEGSTSFVVCLFCDHCNTSFEEILTHMITVHGFNFEENCKKLNLNFYHQVKLINYIRRQIYISQCIHCSEEFKCKTDLLNHMTVCQHFQIPTTDIWDQPQYYFPTYENDTFLCNLGDTKDDTDEEQLCEITEQCNLIE